MCLLAARIRAEEQARRTAARMAEQSQASTAAWLLDGTRSTSLAEAARVLHPSGNPGVCRRGTTAIESAGRRRLTGVDGSLPLAHGGAKAGCRQETFAEPQGRWTADNGLVEASSRLSGGSDKIRVCKRMGFSTSTTDGSSARRSLPVPVRAIGGGCASWSPIWLLAASSTRSSRLTARTTGARCWLIGVGGWWTVGWRLRRSTSRSRRAAP
jgi:hypothetical protein